MAKEKFSDEDLARWKQEIDPAPIIGARTSLHEENAGYIGTCPPCFHDARVGHPDHNPSLRVYKLDDEVWRYKCFSCEAAGDIFEFVQHFDKLSFRDAVKKVLSEAGIAGWTDGSPQPSPALPEREPKEFATFPIQEYKIAIDALEKSEPAKKWLADRGISMETARKFCIGFVQTAEQITSKNLWVHDGWVLFPTMSADRQTVTAVKYRSLVGKKTKQNSGILRAPNTSTTLFNLFSIDPKEDVWIAEGEPDTLVLAQAGLQAVGYPMAGYKPSDEECDILSSAPRRFLAGDSDAAGVKAMTELQKKLHGTTFFIKWPNNRKDANDVLTNECGNDPIKFQALIADLRERASQKNGLAIIRRADQITPKQIRWLWPGKIPLGKMTLFAGNPDNGKSLASTSVAAVVSTGGSFENPLFHTPTADVLMLIGEDDPEDTAVPRLIAAGADLTRVHFLEAVRPVALENREVRLDMDIPAIEEKLAANPDIRVLIVDPISNYLGDVSMVAEQEVRSILIPLKRMAEKFNIAVVIVMHLNKKTDLDAISRVGGAMAFIGVARCSWLFVRNVQEAETEGEDVTPAEKKPDTFSMLRIKNNLVSSSKAGLAYSVKVTPVIIEGESILVPYVVWGEIIEGNADDALNRRSGGQPEPAVSRGPGRPNEKLQRAVQWLEETMQDGKAHRSVTLRKDAKDAKGISAETLDRAYESIPNHVKPTKGANGWLWQLSPMNATRNGDLADEEKTRQEEFQVEGAE